MIPHVLFRFTSDIRTKKNGKTPRFNRRTGRTWLQPKAGTVESQNALHWEAMEQRKGARLPIFDGDVIVELDFRWNGRADVIGLAETVLDALEGVAYENDRQVRTLTMRMHPKGWDLQDDEKVTCTASIMDGS